MSVLVVVIVFGFYCGLSFCVDVLVLLFWVMSM